VPSPSNRNAPRRVAGMVRFDFKLALAIGTVWFFWGSTFAGMHYAVRRFHFSA
jgi:hypothetical protein